jgi:hypothetical protein
MIHEIHSEHILLQRDSCTDDIHNRARLPLSYLLIIESLCGLFLCLCAGFLFVLAFLRSRLLWLCAGFPLFFDILTGYSLP